MDTPVFLGIDIGSASVRAGIFAADGQRLAFAVRPIQQFHPKPLFVEQSSADIWTQTCAAVREAVAKADGRGLSLPFAAISVDPQRRLARLDDATNAPAQRWRLWRAAPTPHHRLALACANEDAHLVTLASLL